LPEAQRDGDLVEAYCRLLNDPNPTVRQRAAEAWCRWESATPAWPPTPGLSPRFTDPTFALAFARIVTHYMSHNAWLEDGSLLRNAGALAAIPGIMVNGRFDFQAPIGNAWELKRVWPRAELAIVDDAGHAADQPGLAQALIRATDQFAGIR
jgi:proline iminopeptidase